MNNTTQGVIFAAPGAAGQWQQLASPGTASSCVQANQQCQPSSPPLQLFQQQHHQQPPQQLSSTQPSPPSYTTTTTTTTTALGNPGAPLQQQQRQQQQSPQWMSVPTHAVGTAGQSWTPTSSQGPAASQQQQLQQHQLPPPPSAPARFVAPNTILEAMPPHAPSVTAVLGGSPASVSVSANQQAPLSFAPLGIQQSSPVSTSSEGLAGRGRRHSSSYGVLARSSSDLDLSLPTNLVAVGGGPGVLAAVPNANETSGPPSGFHHQRPPSAATSSSTMVHLRMMPAGGPSTSSATTLAAAGVGPRGASSMPSPIHIAYAPAPAAGDSIQSLQPIHSGGVSVLTRGPSNVTAATPSTTAAGGSSSRGPRQRKGFDAEAFAEAVAAVSGRVGRSASGVQPQEGSAGVAMIGKADLAELERVVHRSRASDTDLHATWLGCKPFALSRSVAMRAVSADQTSSTRDDDPEASPLWSDLAEHRGELTVAVVDGLLIESCAPLALPAHHGDTPTLDADATSPSGAASSSYAAKSNAAAAAARSAEELSLQLLQHVLRLLPHLVRKQRGCIAIMRLMSAVHHRRAHIAAFIKAITAHAPLLLDGVFSPYVLCHAIAGLDPRPRPIDTPHLGVPLAPPGSAATEERPPAACSGNEQSSGGLPHGASLAARDAAAPLWRQRAAYVVDFALWTALAPGAPGAGHDAAQGTAASNGSTTIAAQSQQRSDSTGDDAAHVPSARGQCDPAVWDVFTRGVFAALLSRLPLVLRGRQQCFVLWHAARRLSILSFADGRSVIGGITSLFATVPWPPPQAHDERPVLQDGALAATTAASASALGVGLMDARPESSLSRMIFGGKSDSSGGPTRDARGLAGELNVLGRCPSRVSGRSAWKKVESDGESSDDDDTQAPHGPTAGRPDGKSHQPSTAAAGGDRGGGSSPASAPSSRVASPTPAAPATMTTLLTPLQALCRSTAGRCALIAILQAFPNDASSSVVEGTRPAGDEAGIDTLRSALASELQSMLTMSAEASSTSCGSSQRCISEAGAVLPIDHSQETTLKQRPGMEQAADVELRIRSFIDASK